MRIIFINFAIFIKESKLFIKDKSVSKRRFHKREKKICKCISIYILRNFQR